MKVNMLYDGSLSQDVPDRLSHVVSLMLSLSCRLSHVVTLCQASCRLVEQEVT